MKSWLSKSMILLSSLLAHSTAFGEVNYDDPNLAMHGGFVSEAATECTRNSNDPASLDRCMNNYTKPETQKQPASEETAAQNPKPPKAKP